MVEVSGLNTLVVRLEESKKDERFKTSLWSSMPEYPIMFSLVHVYQPENVIECGTCSGASSLSYAAALAKLGRGKVYTWDIANRPKVYEGTSAEEAIRFHHGSFSENAPDVVPHIPGSKLFFIDGDHHAEPAYEDVSVALALSQPGDVIVVHDAVKMSYLQDSIDRALADHPEIEVVGRYTIHSRCGIEVIELG
jgi:predicted O-methyltransferase YrrM